MSLPYLTEPRLRRPLTWRRFRHTPEQGAASSLALAGMLIFPFVALLTLIAVLTSHLALPTLNSLALPQVSPTATPGPPISAFAAFLADANTGQVFYHLRSDDQMPMASTTKVMTALLALERGHLDDTITVGTDAAAMVRADSSNMGLKSGEKLTLRELLYGLMLPSGNDAAVAIADYIAGSQDAFVALMNQRAQGLFMTHTHYANPHGLDAPDHYTSAHDLVTVSTVLILNHPEIVPIMTTLVYIIPKTTTHQMHRLVGGNDLIAGARSPYPGAVGVKPGYTGIAGFTMAFAAQRNGHLMVGAVLNDPSWQIRIADMRTLLDWGFTHEGLAAAGPDPKYPPKSQR